MPANREVTKFASRVRSILWSQDVGKEKPTYAAWKSKVEFLQDKNGAAYTKSEAIVQASKDYPCLERLFREYDLRKFDPNPDSHPNLLMRADLEPAKQAGLADGVICANKQQTYRESLQWAIDAAGKFFRTQQKPSVCPCDAAYYLYQQAISEPKDFLGRVGQIESKGISETQEEKDIRRSGKRSLKELESMLQEILQDDS